MAALKVQDKSGAFITIGQGSGGDVVGPSSSTDNAVSRFTGITGKRIQNSVIVIDDAGNVTGVVNLNGKVANDLVTGPASVADNAIARYNSTTGKLIQDSPVVINDVNGNEIIIEPASVDDDLVIRAPTNVGGGIKTLELRGGGGSGANAGGNLNLLGGSSQSGDDGDVLVKVFDANALITLDGGVTFQNGAVSILGGALDLNDQLLSNIGGDHRLMKDADESTSNDATVNDDNTLLTPNLETNTQYKVEGYLHVECGSATPDLRVTVTLPASTTDISIFVEAHRADGASAQRICDVIVTSGQDVLIGLDGSGIDDGITIHGGFKTAGTAGPATLRWAQVTSNATAVTLKAGSYFDVQRRT